MCRRSPPEGAITTVANVARYVMPYAQVEQGASATQVQPAAGPTAVKGKVQVTLRMDTPV